MPPWEDPSIASASMLAYLARENALERAGMRNKCDAMASQPPRSATDA